MALGTKTSLIVDKEIWLRLPEEGDAEAMFAIVDANRMHLREWLPWLDVNQSKEDQLDYIRDTRKRVASTNAFMGAIYFQDCFAGMCGFNVISNKCGAIGYWVAKEFCGQGVGTRATRAIIDYGFEILGLNLVEIRAATSNAASRKIAEKLGMKFEGTLRQREWLYDHFVDHAVYSLTAVEWKSALRG